MMAEQDSYESPQKPSLFSATKTSPPTSNKQHDGPPAGYYQNVTQKGKLILPTAIWVLIIVGGLCFLSLLSSLNKTINSLDTLIEVEQMNALANSKNQLEQPSPLSSSASRPSHHHHHNHQTRKQNQAPDKLELHENPEMEAPPMLGSWFSLPPWASLEPRAEPTGIRSIIDNFMGPSRSGEIVISSTSSLKDLPIESLLKDIIASIDASPNEPASILRKSSLASQSNDNNHKLASQSPVITANIDKVNININSPMPVPESSVDHQRTSVSPAISSHNREHEETFGDLDSMVLSKVFQDTPTPRSHDDEFEESQRKHHKFSGFHPFSFSSMFPHHRQPLSFSDIPDQQFIITFEQEPEQKKKEQQSTPFPQVTGEESSYHLVDSNVHKEDTTNSDFKKKSMKSDLNEEILKSVTKNLFDEIPDSEDVESVVLINGQPLVSEKKQSLSAKESDSSKLAKGQDSNQFKNIFDMFFGPPPDSKLLGSSQSSNEQLAQEIPSLPNETTSAPKNQEQNISIIKTEDNNDPKPTKGFNEENQNSINQLMDGIMGSMFSLPQFGAEQVPMKTEAQSKGDNKDFTTTTVADSNASAVKELIDIPTSSNNKTNELELFKEELRMPTSTSTSTTITTTTTSTSTTSAPVPTLKAEPTSQASPSSIPLTSSTSVPQLLSSLPTIEPLNSTTSAGILDPVNKDLIVSTPSTTTTTPTSTTTTTTTRPPVTSSTDLKGLTTITTTTPSSVSTNLTATTTTTTTTLKSSKAENNSETGMKTTPSTKSFLQKADDFIERNIFNLRRLLA